MSQPVYNDEALLTFFLDLRNPDRDIQNVAFDTLDLILAAHYPRVLELLVTQEPEMQERILSGLFFFENDSAISHPDTFDVIMDLMHQTENEALSRFYLRQALKFKHLAKSFPEDFLQYLLDEDPEIRDDILSLCGRFQITEAVPYITVLLDDDEEYVRNMAQAVLERMPSPEALLALEEWKKRQ